MPRERKSSTVCKGIPDVWERCNFCGASAGCSKIKTDLWYERHYLAEATCKKHSNYLTRGVPNPGKKCPNAQSRDCGDNEFLCSKTIDLPFYPCHFSIHAVGDTSHRQEHAFDPYPETQPNPSYQKQKGKEKRHYFCSERKRKKTRPKGDQNMNNSVQPQRSLLTHFACSEITPQPMLANTDWCLAIRPESTIVQAYPLPEKCFTCSGLKPLPTLNKRYEYSQKKPQPPPVEAKNSSKKRNKFSQEKPESPFVAAKPSPEKCCEWSEKNTYQPLPVVYNQSPPTLPKSSVKLCCEYSQNKPQQTPILYQLSPEMCCEYSKNKPLPPPIIYQLSPEMCCEYSQNKNQPLAEVPNPTLELCCENSYKKHQPDPEVATLSHEICCEHSYKKQQPPAGMLINPSPEICCEYSHNTFQSPAEAPTLSPEMCCEYSQKKSQPPAEVPKPTPEMCCEYSYKKHKKSADMISKPSPEVCCEYSKNKPQAPPILYKLLPDMCCEYHSYKEHQLPPAAILPANNFCSKKDPQSPALKATQPPAKHKYSAVQRGKCAAQDTIQQPMECKSTSVTCLVSSDLKPKQSSVEVKPASVNETISPKCINLSPRKTYFPPSEHVIQSLETKSRATQCDILLCLQGELVVKNTVSSVKDLLAEGDWFEKLCGKCKHNFEEKAAEKLVDKRNDKRNKRPSRVEHFGLNKRREEIITMEASKLKIDKDQNNLKANQHTGEKKNGASANNASKRKGRIAGSEKPPFEDQDNARANLQGQAILPGDVSGTSDVSKVSLSESISSSTLLSWLKTANDVSSEVLSTQCPMSETQIAEVESNDTQFFHGVPKGSKRQGRYNPKSCHAKSTFLQNETVPTNEKIAGSSVKAVKMQTHSRVSKGQHEHLNKNLQEDAAWANSCDSNFSLIAAEESEQVSARTSKLSKSQSPKARRSNSTETVKYFNLGFETRHSRRFNACQIPEVQKKKDSASESEPKRRLSSKGKKSLQNQLEDEKKNLRPKSKPNYWFEKSEDGMAYYADDDAVVISDPKSDSNRFLVIPKTGCRR